MKKRITALVASFFVFVTSFSVSAAPATASEVPTWSEAVAAVAAERASASASEAEIMTLDLTDEDYGIMPFSSVGAVTNTVDRTGVTLVYGYTDLNGIERIKTSYLKTDGSFKIEFDGVLNYFGFEFSSVALPSAGKYKFSYDISSDFSFDYGYTKLQYHKYNSNANTEFSELVTSTLINQSSGDLYLSPQIVTLGSYGSQTNGFGAIHFVNGITNVFSGSVRFCFVKYSGDEEGFVSPGSTSGDVQADYQSGVTSFLGSIGDTLEEIVETISLQLEALWNQMYNYIHLPEYEKLEQIRQAIENIRLDVDIDNQDVVNKIDEQIANDNANTEKLLNSYDTTSSDTAESDLNSALDIGKDSESEAMNSDAVNSFKEFEFPVPSENPPQVINACMFVGNYLQRLYTAIGVFNVPIDVSLVLIIAMLVIGFYRVRMR